MRYSSVAIFLHWTIATTIVANFALGLWMAEAIDAAETQARAITAFQLHKSLGLTVLALSLLRLFWRLFNPPPALPAGMAAWEAWAAKLTHWAFYGFMLAVPFSGWVLVSAQWADDKPLNVPTLWFGLFHVPHLFGLNELADGLRKTWAESAGEAHEVLAWAMAGLLALHIGAALKHHFIVRDDVLARMAPKIGVVIATAVLAATVWLFFKPATVAVTAAEITSSAESNWTVDAAASEVAFSGTHAGVAFRGTFKRWQADIRFNPDDLAHSSVNGSFDTASAQDGNPLHDESLPQAEWFDAEKFPQAFFKSRRITAADGGHRIEGVLVIKGREIPIAPLTMKVAGGTASIEGRFEVSRKDANLGQDSDADAQYVSEKIGVEVRIEARKK